MSVVCSPSGFWTVGWSVAVRERDFPTAEAAAEAAWLALLAPVRGQHAFSVRNAAGHATWVPLNHAGVCDPATAKETALEAAVGDLLGEAWTHREVCEITDEIMHNIGYDVTAGLERLGIECEAPTALDTSRNGPHDPQLRHQLAQARLALEQARHAAANLEWEALRLTLGANLHQLAVEHPDKAAALRELCEAAGCHWPR